MEKSKKVVRKTTTVRLPPDMHAEIEEVAKRELTSMNDVIIERLRAYKDAPTLQELARQNEHTQALVQTIIDALRPRR